MEWSSIINSARSVFYVKKYFVTDELLHVRLFVCLTISTFFPINTTHTIIEYIWTNANSHLIPFHVHLIVVSIKLTPRCWPSRVRQTSVVPHIMTYSGSQQFHPTSTWNGSILWAHARIFSASSNAYRRSLLILLIKWEFMRRKDLLGRHLVDIVGNNKPGSWVNGWLVSAALWVAWNNALKQSEQFMCDTFCLYYIQVECMRGGVERWTYYLVVIWQMSHMLRWN